MRIFLADDQPDVRSALRLRLEQEPGIVVVGEATRHEDILPGIQSTHPDMLLLDWDMPGLSTADLVTRLHPAIKIVALSSRPENYCCALEAGADAFISKGDAPERVVQTIYRFAAVNQS